jgi:adenine-specific DNA-methyltransferase
MNDLNKDKKIKKNKSTKNEQIIDLEINDADIFEKNNIIENKKIKKNKSTKNKINKDDIELEDELNFITNQTNTSNLIKNNKIIQLGDKKNDKPIKNSLSEKKKINDNVSYYNIDILNLDIIDKFDLIYLDPPYETNRTFTINSLDDDTGFDDNWDEKKYSEWIEKLITKLKNLLTNKGTLVFHISSEHSFVVEGILINHFKKIQKIYWKRCHGKNTVKNKMGEVIDTLFACWNGNNIFNLQYIPIDEDSVWAFKNKDKRGFYSLGALKHDRTRIGNVYKIEHNGVVYENKYGWKQKKEDVEELIKEDRIHFVPDSKNMYVKIYKHEHKGVPLSNLWTDIHSITRTAKDPRLYPTQKPQKLLERIIKMYSDENSLILDPVCGSGTTGFVGDKLNRKCVLCDINKDTFDIIKKRFNDKIYNI